MAEILMYAMRYTGYIYFANSEQCYHFTSMDSQIALVTSHEETYIPESYSIVYIYVKQHLTVPILFNLMFGPMILTTVAAF